MPARTIQSNYAILAIKSTLAVLAFLCIAFIAKSQKTILFIGAHPDETAIGEVLAKYAAMGNNVFVMVATDGKDGTRVTSIPAGDSLGSMRKKESACGCNELGIQPPIFLGIDRLDTKIGVGNYFRCHKQLMDSLLIKIPLLQPDVIITAGPDGDTHHAEHIVVSGAVTELLLREGWVEKYSLYYMAWKKGKEDVDDLGYVDEQYFNAEIKYSQGDENKAMKALECYATQYTTAEIKEENNRKLKDTGNTMYFRKFTVQKGMQQDF